MSEVVRICSISKPNFSYYVLLRSTKENATLISAGVGSMGSMGYLSRGFG